MIILSRLRARSARPTVGSAGSGDPRGFAARGEGARAPSRGIKMVTDLKADS